jgi:hypothetical protein
LLKKAYARLGEIAHDSQRLVCAPRHIRVGAHIDPPSKDASGQSGEASIVPASKFQFYLAKSVKAKFDQSLQKFKAGLGGYDRAVSYTSGKCGRRSEPNRLLESMPEAVKQREIDGTPSCRLWLVSAAPLVGSLTVAFDEKPFDFLQRSKLHTKQPRQEPIPQSLKRPISGFARHVFARQTLAVAYMSVLCGAFNKQTIGRTPLCGGVFE